MVVFQLVKGFIPQKVVFNLTLTRPMSENQVRGGGKYAPHGKLAIFAISLHSRQKNISRDSKDIKVDPQ